MNFYFKVGDPETDGFEVAGEGSPVKITLLLRKLADVMEERFDLAFSLSKDDS